MVRNRQQQKQQNAEAQWNMKPQLIQEKNRIQQVTDVKTVRPSGPVQFEGTQSCDVSQQGSTFRQVVRACLWDLLVSFYFYNRRHNVRYNGRILCARVAPA
jgi:hypothetical protein